jgi:hypothetical protein
MAGTSPAKTLKKRFNPNRSCSRPAKTEARPGKWRSSTLTPQSQLSYAGLKLSGAPRLGRPWSDRKRARLFPPDIPCGRRRLASTCIGGWSRSAAKKSPAADRRGKAMRIEEQDGEALLVPLHATSMPRVRTTSSVAGLARRSSGRRDLPPRGFTGIVDRHSGSYPQPAEGGVGGAVGGRRWSSPLSDCATDLRGKTRPPGRASDTPPPAASGLLPQSHPPARCGQQ